MAHHSSWLPLGPATPPLPRFQSPSIKSPSVQSASITVLGFLKKQSSLCGKRQMHMCITSRHRWNTRIVTASLDPDLHSVLELASDAELFELSNILYGRSLLSPLIKSVASGDGPQKLKMGGKTKGPEPGGRDAVMERLESRFLFLGADAKATLRGQRPTYRDVLLRVCMKLSVPCSIKLSTEDLEAEIFLHLLQQYSSNKSKSFLRSPWKYQNETFAGKADVFTQGPEGWRYYLPFALKLGGEEMLKVVLKGGSVFTISTLQNMVARRLGGKVLLETARYQVAKEVLKKGGQAAASKLQIRVALLAARQGLVGAASCYMALQRTSMLLGPLLWGTFLADIVIRSVGTDYARVVRAIYAFAQIRLLRTYGWTQAERTILN